MNPNLETLKTTDPPDNTWVERLRRGNYIWLVKEKRFAVIEWEWEPPSPSQEFNYHLTGRLGFKNVYQHGWVDCHQETWFVTIDGCGIDRQPLIQPVKGHLPDNLPSIDESEIKRLKRTVASLIDRVTLLEKNSKYSHGFW